MNRRSTRVCEGQKTELLVETSRFFVDTIIYIIVLNACKIIDFRLFGVTRGDDSRLVSIQFVGTNKFDIYRISTSGDSGRSGGFMLIHSDFLILLVTIWMTIKTLNGAKGT